MQHLRTVLLSASVALAGLATAQDTVHVQTLTFDSITTRRGWYVFPDTTHHYRKVLLHHTLKCDPATTQDQYDCGEWDYLTYNFIHDHTGVLDSTAMQAPWFKVGSASPASVAVAGQASQDLWLEPAPQRTILAVGSESDHTVGVADATDASSLYADRGTTRSQYLFTAAELMAAGVQVGMPIERLRFQVLTGGDVARLIVRVKQTTAMLLTTFDGNGLLEVYHQTGGMFLTAGTATLDLHTPFTWDGTSNLLVDLSTDKWTNTGTPVLQASNVSANTAVQQVGRDGSVIVNNDFIALDPAPLAGINTQVTIMFRAKGDAVLPIQTSAFEARDAQNNRVLNVHLPWSNGNVYWDAGNVGTAYDRIFLAAAAADYEGQWTNWAFTKNTVTGSMKIYKNGVLWHSGTGMTRPMSGIAKVNFGAAYDRTVPYAGQLDDLVILDTELNAATIAAWAGREITPAHPAWANVRCAFNFNETNDLPHVAVNAADPTHPAWLMGTVQRAFARPQDLAHAEQTVNVRPDITFTQGTYTDQLNNLFLPWPQPRPGIALEYFQVNANSVTPIDTVFGYTDGWSYTYAPDSTATDSTLSTGTVTTNDTLDYYSAPVEVVNRYEIGRYVTPYGIGLSLGPNGFRWTYDVTDYQYLLHDSVDLQAGSQSELIDLEFELIEGIAPRKVVQHQRPWGGMASRSYGGLSDNTLLPPVSVGLHPQATQWSLFSRLTGHGHNSSNGNYPHCCEWKDNTHYMFANGTQVDQWHVWQTNDCALNPVYPQGGTWLGSREGWCPGDLVKDHETNLTPYVTGDSITVDYAISPVPPTNPGMAGGSYVVNMDLFEYGPARHALDAEIRQVKRPSDEGYHSRENPICMEPVIVLRNAGAQDLTSVQFAYGVSGGTLKYHSWTGLLKHMQEEVVTLPITDGAFWIGDNAHIFTVTVSNPNGGADEYADNNSYSTHFNLPAAYTDNFIVYLKTNNRAYENSVTIRDMAGTVVYSRSGMANQTTYQDTLSLWDGCYTLELMDTGNDGLAYWADTQQGNGQFRLKKFNGATLKSFEPEFGRSIHWAFTIGGFVGIQEQERAFALTAFPNPTSGDLRVHIADMDGPGQLDVLDGLGRIVMSRPVELTGDTDVVLDLSGHTAGLYMVRITAEGRSSTLRVMLR